MRHLHSPRLCPRWPGYWKRKSIERASNPLRAVPVRAQRRKPNRQWSSTSPRVGEFPLSAFISFSQARCRALGNSAVRTPSPRRRSLGARRRRPRSAHPATLCEACASPAQEPGRWILIALNQQTRTRERSPAPLSLAPSSFFRPVPSTFRLPRPARQVPRETGRPSESCLFSLTPRLGNFAFIYFSFASISLVADAQFLRRLYIYIYITHRSWLSRSDMKVYNFWIYRDKTYNLQFCT